MSLLEDIVALLRCVLEYFGVPNDMLVPVWESELCGQYRSIVRMVGTNLPLNPYPRVHFQVPLQAFRRHGQLNVSLEAPAVPSLADVRWLDEDEGESFARVRHRHAVELGRGGLPRGVAVALGRDGVPRGVAVALGRDGVPRGVAVALGRDGVPRGETVGAGGPGLAAAQRGSRLLGQRADRDAQPGSRPLGQRAEPDALRKISALEDELLKLRAQIAMIVTAHAADPAPGTPWMSPPPTPILTSTPLCPPPPPPPPLPLSAPPSVLEVIQGRQVATRSRPRQSELSVGSGPATGLSMLDVLKDLNQVKLRTVERSPGGTPVRKRSKAVVRSCDPAALIAEALKRKFAHRRRDDSPNKENQLSPFGSPETPWVPHHTRQSQGRMHL